MKNKLNLLLVLAVMVFVIGCSCGSLDQFTKQDSPSSDKPKDTTKTTTQNSNKSLTDHATDVVTTGEKIGIAECDELMDYFRAKIENENTDMISKAVLKTLESQFREGIKKSIEQNNTDRESTAKFCKEFKKNIDDQEAKKQP